jgi:hypothetical protein
VALRVIEVEENSVPWLRAYLMGSPRSLIWRYHALKSPRDETLKERRGKPSLLCPLTDKLPRVAGGAVDDEFTCHWMPSHSSCISRVTGPAGTPP